jgi:hypothetical protein
LLSQVRTAGVSYLTHLQVEFSESGVGGSDREPLISGGFSTAESHPQTEVVTAAAVAEFEEEAGSGREGTPPVPAGRFERGEFDSEVSRFT